VSRDHFGDETELSREADSTTAEGESAKRPPPRRGPLALL
jgi:hypothetical protein